MSFPSLFSSPATTTLTTPLVDFRTGLLTSGMPSLTPRGQTAGSLASSVGSDNVFQSGEMSALFTASSPSSQARSPPLATVTSGAVANDSGLGDSPPATHLSCTTHLCSGSPWDGSPLWSLPCPVHQCQMSRSLCAGLYLLQELSVLGGSPLVGLAIHISPW